MAAREAERNASNGGQPGAAVLIVDDDAGKRLALRAMMAPLVCDIIEADSGRAALRAVLRQPFAAIVMDVRMPSMDGYETAKLIRDRSDLALTPIIFVTAYGCDEVDTAAAYASGAVDFIFTPIDPAVLRAKILVFVDLFLQSQELQRSFDSLTDLHAVLDETEIRAQVVLDNTSDGIIAAGESGRIEVFNASAQRLFGYRDKEVIGKPFHILIAPEHHPDLPSLSSVSSRPPDASETPEPAKEMLGCRKDGSSFSIEIRTTSTQLDERYFMVACVSDVSALKQQAERDRIAFDEAPIGSMITDPTGTVERINDAMCTMLGYTSEALIGTRLYELTHPDDHEQSDSVLAALTAGTSGVERFEKRYINSTGDVIEASVVVTPIRAAGKIVQLFAQVQDVTDARRNSRELENAQFEMLARLAAAGELHDDTGQHTRRVGKLSAAIAEELGLPEAEVRMIRFAAPLHDIGKLGVPHTILSKPGKLTTAEFDQMKTHCSSGAQMLTGSAHGLMNLAEQVALTHHEKWDGGGYPAGLAGEAIPIAGRIVAVADVFDALTHARPYKEAWSAPDAIREMTSQTERHFDPRVLQAFLRIAPADSAPADSGRLVAAK